MPKSQYREKSDHTYKGFLIWGTGEHWVLEPLCFSPENETKEKYWKVRNAAPSPKTLREAKVWIGTEGIKLLEKVKGE